MSSCQLVATFLRLKLTNAVSLPTAANDCQLNLTNSVSELSQTFPTVKKNIHYSFVLLSDTRETTPADGSGGILYNFELSVAVRQVGGEDFQPRGNPKRPGSTSARGAAKPGSGVSTSGPVVTF